MDEYAFDFTKVDNFLDDLNREGKFDSLDMDGISKNYKMVLVSECPNDIEKCLDKDGTLNDEVEIIDTLGVDDGLCSLLWSKGINSERSISFADSSVTYNLGDNTADLKAVFLVNMVEGSGYVLAYSINSYSFPIEGEIILPCDGMLWSMRNGG